MNPHDIPHIVKIYDHTDGSLLKYHHIKNENTQNIKKRKQRIVKNPDVNIDDVKIEAGYNYFNWIQITKQKLTQREGKLMQRRKITIQNVINETINKYRNNKFYIDTSIYNEIMNKNYDIIETCLDKLKIFLNEWNGVNLNHTKKNLSTFREYFIIGRSWFDQRKKEILATQLWIKVFNVIISMTKLVSEKAFKLKMTQNSFQSCILLQICLSIFEAKLRCPATRPHQLLACSILKDSMPFKKYIIENIDKSLSVDKLIQENGFINKKMTAKDFMMLIIKQLRVIASKSTKEFQDMLSKIKTDDDNITTINPINPINLHDFASIISENEFNANNNNNNNNNDNNVTLFAEGCITGSDFEIPPPITIISNGTQQYNIYNPFNFNFIEQYNDNKNNNNNNNNGFNAFNEYNNNNNNNNNGYNGYHSASSSFSAQLCRFSPCFDGTKNNVQCQKNNAFQNHECYYCRANYLN